MTIIKFFKQVMPFFWNKDKAIRLLIVLSIFFGLFSVALNLSIPVALRYIINYLTVHVGQAPTVGALLIIASYGIIWLLAQISLTLRSVSLFIPMQRASRKMIHAFFEQVLKLPLSYHLDRKTGGLLTAIEQAQLGLRVLINGLLWQIIPLALEVIFAVAITWWMYGFVYGLMVFATLTLYFLSTFFTTNQSIKYQSLSFEKDREVTDFLHDSMLNYETIKYFNNEKVELTRCDDILALRENATLKIDLRMFFINMIQMIIVGVGLIIITSYAGYNILTQHLTIGDFVLLNGYILQFSIPMSYFGYVIREVKQSVISINNAFEMLKLNQVNKPTSLNTQVLNTPIVRLAFNDVCFSYDNQRNVLDKVSFNVASGKTIAIVGPTGSGKSTISKLLYRFFDTTSGTILLNDTAYNSLTTEAIQKVIGVVPQEPVLFNNTLRYNIAYGSNEASENEIWGAIEDAGLKSFVDGLPKGLETIVGERGLKISGGEKQRVAIARMLLKKPEIYIFDEATSALDVETEQKVQKNIEKISLNKTTVIISHRLATVKNADEILVLQDGKIIERGSHDTLLARKGYYFEMYHKQSHRQSDSSLG
jgi:ABC-type transport system involved in Fe-S cluster assembly fused permease/ATPase subunit